MIDASIVVPCYNSCQTIEQCLNSLLSQKSDARYEVIVVDSSTDGTAGVVSKLFPQVKLITLPERVLSGRARNIGVAASSSDIILFTDSDCIVEDTWLDQMLATHARNEFAGVAGSVVNGNPESAISWAGYIMEFSEYMPGGSARIRTSSPTCNISYRRSVFKKHGGFDERLRQYVDYEFNSRLQAHGERLLFVPDIHVRHWHRTSLCDYVKHEIRRGRAAVTLREFGALPGRWAVESRLLCSLATPAVVARRILADTRRFAFSRVVPARKLISIGPYFILGSLAWGLGFLLQGLATPVRKHTAPPENLCKPE